MWLVLEGIDGAGKSTLAHSLCVQYGFCYRHVGPPGSTDLVDGAWPALARAWWRDERPNVVWDRGHLGEFVYGVDRGFDPEPMMGWLRLLEAILMERRGAVVWLNRDPRLAVNAQPAADHRDLATLLVHQERYRLLHESGRLATMAEVEGEDGPAHVLERVSKVLELLDQEPVTHEDHEGVGCAQPVVWLLGEQVSRAADLTVPFATPSGLDLVWPMVVPTRCRVSNVLRSWWDLGPARHSGLAEWQVDDLYRRWATLGEPQVICLGRTAERACLQARVPIFGALEHPQYWRRFYHYQGPAYLDRLGALIHAAGGHAESQEIVATMIKIGGDTLRRLLGGEELA